MTEEVRHSYPKAIISYHPKLPYKYHVDFDPPFLIENGHLLYGQKFYVIAGALAMIKDYIQSSPTSTRNNNE